jgi:putative ABC transport system permease protein
MLRDIRLAVRTLLKNRLSTILVILVLALGIGAGTVVFSAVKSVLLFRAISPHPEELVMLCETDPHSPMDPVSYPDFLDWRRQSQPFAELAAYQFWNFNLKSGETAVHVPGAWVSTNYFHVWRVAPLIGRAFATSTRPEAVVSHGFWQRRFGGDKAILGSTLALDEIAYTVVGVMPANFTTAPTEVWVPIDFHADQLMDRGEHLDLFAYGRMRPGVSIERAQSEMDTIARRLAREFAGTNTDVGVRLTRPGEWATGPVRPALMVLSGSVIAVALLVFANVTCLMLARAGARRNETAVRTALGASRWQTARPFVAESMLVALAGGCLGAFLAHATPTRLLTMQVALPREKYAGEAGVTAFLPAASGKGAEHTGRGIRRRSLVPAVERILGLYAIAGRGQRVCGPSAGDRLSHSHSGLLPHPANPDTKRPVFFGDGRCTLGNGGYCGRDGC